MRTALWHYASRLTGIPVERILWANYNQSTPQRPFATLQIINSQSGNETHTATGAGGATVMRMDTTLTLQIQVYADATPFEAFDIARHARQRAHLTTERQLLRADGLAMVDVLSVTDAPALVGTTWESRAIMDMQLRTLTTLSDNVGLIERVEIVGDVNDINVIVNPEV